MQIFLPLKPNNQSSLSNLSDCLNDIKSWMAHNFLQLNENKLEVVLFSWLSPGLG